MREFLAEAKVGDDDASGIADGIAGEEDVLGLDVAVDDLEGVEMRESGSGLGEDGGGWESALLLHLRLSHPVRQSARAQLESDVAELDCPLPCRSSG